MRILFRFLKPHQLNHSSIVEWELLLLIKSSGVRLMRLYKIITILYFVLFFYSPTNNAQTLDYFLNQGLANSPLLKDYQNQIYASALDSLLVKSAQLPQIGLNSQFLVAPVYSHFGYDEAITNGGNYSGVVAVTQPFFNQKNLSNKFKSISIQKQSLQNSSKISTSELKRVITNLYLTAFADLSDLKFNKTFLKIMQGEVEIIQQLVTNGVYKQTDYLSLRIEQQSLEIRILQIKGQYEKDMQLLNQICGLSDSTGQNISIPLVAKADLPNPILSPLFIQYKIDSLRISNEKIAIENRYRPKLSWYADAGFSSSIFLNIYQHFGYSAGINLSFPIYDGNQRKLEIEKLSISEDSRTHYEWYFKNQYASQVLQLNNELSISKNITAKLNKQLATSEELLFLSKNQLNYGNIAITEFINVLKNYNTINHELNQWQVKSLMIINELNYLMQQ